MPRPSRTPSPTGPPASPPLRIIVLAALGLAVTVLVSLGILAVAEGVSQARGGGIEAAVTRTGTTSSLVCRRAPASLGLSWTCTGEVAWLGPAQLPSRVAEQKPPYQVLAATDITGTPATVTGHLPMGWQSAGSWRGGYPSEIVVAEPHPVGSATWWAVQVWSPLAVVAVVVAAGLTAQRSWLRAGIRRRARDRRR